MWISNCREIMLWFKRNAEQVTIIKDFIYVN